MLLNKNILIGTCFLFKFLQLQQAQWLMNVKLLYYGIILNGSVEFNK